MAFWTDKGAAGVEPLRKFRFKIQLGNDSVMWWAKSVTQPSPEVSISEHQLINHKIKFPGIATWNDIDIIIVDIGRKGKEFIDKLTASGYNTDGNTDGIKKSQYNGSSDFVITKIDANGKPIETWNLVNPFIKSIKYGDLDYSSDDLVEITITVAYDSATLT